MVLSGFLTNRGTHVEEDKIPPAGLHQRLVTKLLDSLESDEGFRAMFQQSPEEALRSLGYTDPWDCMQMRSGAKLASPEQIREQRVKLEESLLSVQQLLCPVELMDGASAQ